MTFGSPTDSAEQAGPHHTSITLDSPAGLFDPMGNHAHEAYSTSIDQSADPGLRAYEDRLRQNGFLGGTSTNTTATDVSVGRKD